MVDSDGFSGRQVGRYLLQDLIGRGGMSTVYRAYDVDLERYVAFKVLSRDLTADLQSDIRFTQEAKIVAKLEYPSIVPIHDYGQVQGLYYIVMRLLTGGSLETRLDQKQLSLEEAARVLEQLAAALDYAHSQSVVHRDIKPSNVLCDPHGNAYLADFGVAKILNISSALTLSGRILGTPSYMAPELWRDEDASPRSDIYALGVLMYRALSGKLPFEASSPMALMRKHLYETPTPLNQLTPEISPYIEAAVAAAMVKDSSQRYPTAAAFSQAFRDALAHTNGSQRLPVTSVLADASTTMSSPARPTPSGPQRWSIKGVSLTVAVALMSLLVLFIVIRIIVIPPPTATPASGTVAATQHSPTATPPAPVSSPTLSATIEPSSTLTSTPQPLGGAPSVVNAAYAPVTPSLNMQIGVMSTQQPSQEHRFSWNAGDILKICLSSNEFDADFEVFAPDGTITPGQNDNGTPCITPYVAPITGEYRVRIHSITGRDGRYSLNLTLYSACASGLPIAVRNAEIGGALPAIRESSITYSSLVSTAVPDECFAVIGQDGDWWHIRAQDGRIGWIARDLVTVIGTLEATSAPAS